MTPEKNILIHGQVPDKTDAVFFLWKIESDLSYFSILNIHNFFSLNAPLQQNS